MGKDKSPLQKKPVKRVGKPKDPEVPMGTMKPQMKKWSVQCHSDLGSTMYGCHIKWIILLEKVKIDWIASGSTHFANGETSESVLGTKGKKQIGKAHETRSY